MRETEYYRWWLPARPGRKTPHLSRWAMCAEDAAKLGALRPELSTREVRLIPETEEERQQAMANSPGVAIMQVKR